VLAFGVCGELAPISSQPRPRLICLIGFMGTGKSTVARLLSRQIGWKHVDLDKRVTETAGMEITAIFARQGEPAFRRMETEELRRVLGEAVETAAPTVVSLGGGTTTQPANLELLRACSASLVWLHCPVEELLSRISRITNRPLFRDEASFRLLYEQRLPSYELADYRVESNVEPLRVVEQILNLGILEKVQTL
jgi:shikimate kinase